MFHFFFVQFERLTIPKLPRKYAYNMWAVFLLTIQNLSDGLSKQNTNRI